VDKFWIPLVVGVFSAIISAGLIYALKISIGRKVHAVLSRPRRLALVGRWRGVVHQDRGPWGKSIEYSLTMNIHGKFGELVGDMSASFKSGDEAFEYDFNLKGSVFHDRLLRIDYIDKVQSSIHFGVMMFMLDGFGRSLKGHFVAYGVQTEEIITGVVSLEKMP